MVPVDLTRYFTLESLSRSDTAMRRGIENVPNAGEVANLARLCESLLEPAQSLMGAPIIITSGYRSPALNQALGGATNSAHMDGRACDFKITLLMDLHEVFDQLRKSSLPYDQIIFECGAWIHLAVARAGVDPRRQALMAKGGPGHWSYERVDG